MCKHNYKWNFQHGLLIAGKSFKDRIVMLCFDKLPFLLEVGDILAQNFFSESRILTL